MNTTSLHDLIETHKDEILRQWTTRMIDSAFAEGLSVAELVGVMPEYLSSLGASAPSDPAQLDVVQRDLVERHLSSRLRQGATLNEILSEFATLSRCVAASLDQAPRDSQPTTRDAARMFTEMHAACVSSMRIFNEQLLEDEQTMKRYLRLLQRAADHGGELDDGGRPIVPLLEEALVLITRALGARAAALHLDDRRSGKRIASVAAGVAGEAIETHVSAMEISLPPAPPPERSGEVDFVALAVSDELRASGVDALIAVSPATRHALRCVLYIGAGRGRTFLAHEIRLAESLGQALLIHLDHAQLCSALVARAAEAGAECQLRERFVSILMHDLAGPLSAARAGAERLADVPGAGGDAAVVAGELDRVAGMVNSLVDAHRIRAGHPLPVNVADCDLVVLAREVIEELRAAHGDRFLLRGNQSVPGVWSGDQLRRAIWNLGQNAARFGTEGGPVIITVKRRDGGAELAVNNQGPEIPMEEQSCAVRPIQGGAVRPRPPARLGSGPHAGLGLRRGARRRCRGRELGPARNHGSGSSCPTTPARTPTDRRAPGSGRGWRRSRPACAGRPGRGRAPDREVAGRPR